MAEAALQKPGILAPVGRTWVRISPSLMPILAVLTALLITIPFMIVTGGRGDIGRGLGIAGTAYSALIEGSLGIAINDTVSRDDLSLVTIFTERGSFTSRDLRRLGQTAAALAVIGDDPAQRYAEILPTLGELDSAALAELSISIGEAQTVGGDTLEAMRPLIADLSEAERSEVRTLAEQFRGAETLPNNARAEIAALAPSAAELSDDDLLRFMKIVQAEGIVRLNRLVATIDRLTEAGIALDSPDAADLAAIATLNVGAASTDPAQAARAAAGAVLDASEIVESILAAGVTDPTALNQQVQLVRALYSQGMLTNEDVGTALNQELSAVVASNTLIRRPGDRLIVGSGTSPVGVVTTTNASGAVVPQTLYARLGNSALVFFPENLEQMLVRSIPFIIAGLAVALGFKAGVFNIGAEGQLYAGAILSVWVGISPIFAGLPPIIHLPLIIVMGILGGFLWGAIPGALKAYTGAHEVITTIMLNYIAIRLVDWLIKSTDPVILLDIAASTPKTPDLAPALRMPSFAQLSPWVIIAAGIVVFVLALWARRKQLKDARVLIQPAILGAVTILAGIFLQYIAVRGALHLGFIIMLAAVWLTDWFLQKTTLGFELRTVGANSDAARYAGMNVRWNVVLALALGGALAGLAGVIEVTGVQYNMKPAFFAGVGFDAIAVALLARSNPRSMPFAGLLWGALLTGAGLMQIRANISIDLVKIIQALIIMFIAADAIIRYLWRVPKSDERVTNVFAKGWGS
jgi:simple sugar transport system permease protein